MQDINFQIMKFGLLICSIFIAKASFLKSALHREKGLRHHVVSDLGSPSGIKEYPFQAIIARKNNGSFKCGATILSKQFVLTSSRCNGPDLGKLSVRTGLSAVVPHEGAEYNIKKVHVHPLFQQPKRYDAALFEIDGEIEFSATSQPINLLGRKDEIFDDMKTELVGWSEKENTGSEDPSKIVFLMKTSESLMTYNSCAPLFPKMQVVNDLICNDPNFGRTACMSHPGSSLVDNWKLYGVLLNDMSCEYPRLPKLFLNVAAVRDWILKVTGIPDPDDVTTLKPEV